MPATAPTGSADERIESAESQIRLETIPFGRITGEHPAVDSVRKKTVGFLRDLPIDAFTTEGLAYSAGHTPLHVVPKGDNYECIGHFRLYRLLKSALSPADHLPVIVHPRLGGKRLERFILFELLIVPVLYRLDSTDRKRMNIAWKNPNSAGLIDRVVQPVVSPRGKERSPLARLLNCDARSLEEPDETAADKKAGDSKPAPKAAASDGRSNPEPAAARKRGAA